MENEIAAAVKWWADCLRSPRPHNNGDAMQSMLSTAVTRSKSPLSEEQIAGFEKSLEATIRRSCQECWDPAEPSRGSYFRTIGVDYGPDLCLVTAANVGGFDIDYRLPIKTVMWINPGEVKVAEGYGAAPKVIWSTQHDRNKDG